jgi:hypothetical protein
MPQEMVIEVLEERSIRFTDVGMGVQLNDHRLGRVVRVTTSTPQVRDHFLSRVSFEDAAGNDEGMDSDFPSSVGMDARLGSSGKPAAVESRYSGILSARVDFQFGVGHATQHRLAGLSLPLFLFGDRNVLSVGPERPAVRGQQRR